jgi:hypothetical protein
MKIKKARAVEEVSGTACIQHIQGSKFELQHLLFSFLKFKKANQFLYP